MTAKQVQFEEAPEDIIPIISEPATARADGEAPDEEDELLDLQDEIDFLLDHIDSLQQETSICWRGLEDAKKRKDSRFLYRNQVLDRHDELAKQSLNNIFGEEENPADSLKAFAANLSIESHEQARKRAMQDAVEAKSILETLRKG